MIEDKGGYLILSVFYVVIKWRKTFLLARIDHLNPGTSECCSFA